MHTILFVIVSLSLYLCCVATNYTWNAGSGGDWSDSTKWTPSGVPGANDYVFFVNQGGCTGFGGCPVSVGDVTVMGIIGDRYGVYTLTSGTLTTTTYSSFWEISFSNLVLNTNGYTTYPNIGGYTTMKMVNTQWTMQGTTTMPVMDWTLTSSTITNNGDLSVTSMASPRSDDNDDFSRSRFVNAGTMRVAAGQWRISITSTNDLTVTSGFFSIFGMDKPAPQALTTSWSGSLAVQAGATLNFYTGQHTFNSGLNLGTAGKYYFQGGQAASFFMNVTINIPVSMTNLQIDYKVNVAFNFPTTIQNLLFRGGILAGQSRSILINNVTFACDTSGLCPTFVNGFVTIMNGTSTEAFYVAAGTNLQINGSFYSAGLAVNSPVSGVGGSITFNPSSTLYLYAFDSEYTPRHFTRITTNLLGSVIALPPRSALPCYGRGSLVQFAAGGVVAGTLITLDCGNNNQDAEYDVNFAGGFTYQPGVNLTGAGTFTLSGKYLDWYPDRTHTFNTPLTALNLNFRADPIVVLNANLHITNLIWNGGIVQVGAPTFALYLDPGNHQLTGVLGYSLILDGATMINNGRADVKDSASLSTVDGGLVINNQVMLVSRSSFSNQNTATIINRGNITSVSGGMWFATVTNEGTIQTSSVDIASSIQLRDDASFIMSNSSVVRLNLFGNAQAYGLFSPPFDQLVLNSDTCQFGGELYLNFVQPAKKPGQPTTAYVPRIGEEYPLIATAKAAGKAVCQGQWDKVTAVGLNASYAVGLNYDVGLNGYTAILVNVVICDKANTTCASIRRASVASTTTSSQTTSASTTSSGPTPNPATTSLPSSAKATSTTDSSSSAPSGSPMVTFVVMLFIMLVAL